MIDLLDGLSTTVGGLRSALVLLAVGALLTLWHMPRPSAWPDVLRRRVGVLFAFASVIYSPVHAAWLLGRPAPKVLARFLDLGASLTACICIIHLLASWAVQRGVSEERVRRGMWANAAVVVAIVVVTWMLR